MAVLCGMHTIQYSALSARLYLIRASLGPPVLNANGISIVQPFLQGSLVWQTDRQIHATRSVTTGRIYVHITAM